MAKSTKSTQLAAPAAPAAPRPTLASTVLDSFRARYHAADHDFRARHAKFTAATAKAITYSIEYWIGGQVEGLARTQALAEWWKVAVEMLEAPAAGATFQDRLTALGLRAHRAIGDLARHRQWEVSSTCQVSNILKRAEVSGQAQAWTEVLDFCEAMDRRDAIVDDVTPVAEPAADPAEPAAELLAIGPDGQPA
jgi:hypothetical protein